VNVTDSQCREILLGLPFFPHKLIWEKWSKFGTTCKFLELCMVFLQNFSGASGKKKLFCGRGGFCLICGPNGMVRYDTNPVIKNLGLNDWDFEGPVKKKYETSPTLWVDLLRFMVGVTLLSFVHDTPTAPWRNPLLGIKA